MKLKELAEQQGWGERTKYVQGNYFEIKLPTGLLLHLSSIDYKGKTQERRLLVGDLTENGYDRGCGCCSSDYGDDEVLSWRLLSLEADNGSQE